uniref:Uncharacterized protein n=1 Tax=Panagrolaimus davidi TaxID=227884 RepID=A0A914PT21_9BILA
MLFKLLFFAWITFSHAFKISFTAFEHGEQNSFEPGKIEKLYLIDDECGELQNVHDKITSIDTNECCIILFEERRCQGKSIIVKPGCTDNSCCSPDSFVYCGFNDRATSYRACPNPFYNVLFWFITIPLIFVIGFLLIGIAIPFLKKTCHFRMRKSNY